MTALRITAVAATVLFVGAGVTLTLLVVINARGLWLLLLALVAVLSGDWRS